MATKSKVTTEKVKDSWCYFVNKENDTYNLFPSYEAAYKDAVNSIKTDRYDYGGSPVKPIKVRFYRLASESTFEFEVKETPVMKREIVFKGGAK